MHSKHIEVLSILQLQLQSFHYHIYYLVSYPAVTLTDQSTVN